MLLRHSGDSPEESIFKTPEADSDTEEQLQDEPVICCRRCHQVVTRPEERIEKNGAHQHTFANPQGHVFEIGCFRSAEGCAYEGPAIYEFSWFSGYGWRVAVCRSCLNHLGWLYVSKGLAPFHGLILDRLIEP